MTPVTFIIIVWKIREGKNFPSFFPQCCAAAYRSDAGRKQDGEVRTVMIHVFFYKHLYLSIERLQKNVL